MKLDTRLSGVKHIIKLSIVISSYFRTHSAGKI